MSHHHEHHHHEHSHTIERLSTIYVVAVALNLLFVIVEAAAGFIGKDKRGWRCGACGSFMDAPMDAMTESQIDSAIRSAEAGRGRQAKAG